MVGGKVDTSRQAVVNLAFSVAGTAYLCYARSIVSDGRVYPDAE